MLKVILENLFKQPATRKYPFEKREPFKEARGQLLFDASTCIYCGICQKKCPSNCIQVSRQDKSWELETYSCIVCGACADACPKKSLSLAGAHRTAAFEKVDEKVVAEKQ